MRKIGNGIPLIVVFLAVYLTTSTATIMSQAKHISYAELLTWIADDETKTDIKAWITQRKLDFEVTNDRLREIKTRWKDVKLGNMPADLERCIKDNAALPQPPQPPPPPLTATLVVDCANTPCNLAMNGKPFGAASPGKPYIKAGLEPAVVTVLATADGYKDNRNTITLIPGDRPNRLSFEMEKLTGSVQVTCEPADCDIYLDGNRIGATNRKQLSLSGLIVGDHEIEARIQGFDSIKQRISVVADSVQSVSIKMKRTLPDGVTLARVKKEMLDDYFFSDLGSHANISYVATWKVSSPAKSATVTIKEKVTGTIAEWTKCEYTAKLVEHATGFNIYDILGRIRSDSLKLDLQAVDEAEAQAIKKVAAPVSESDKYIKLIAEDNSDLYELTLEEFAPCWIPVIVKHQKKDGSKETRTVACPIPKGYEKRLGYYLPGLVRILDPKTWATELEAKLDNVERR
jgi:hypothetical protein